MKRRPIAIVEDSDEDFTAILRAVRAIDPPVEMRRFRTGEAFLAAVANQRAEFDSIPFLVALLDLNLPGRSGMAVLDFMRREEWSTYLPIVVLSGSAQQQGIDDAYRLGARGYVVKPFDSDELAHTMRAVVEYWRTVRPPRLATIDVQG